MWLVKPDIEEERLLSIALLIQPGDRFIHDQLAGVSLKFANPFPVAPEVARVAMAGRCVQVGREPIVESVLVDPRLVHLAKRRPQMPLAQVRRVITIRLQDLRNRHLALAQVHVVNVVLNNGENPGA